MESPLTAQDLWPLVKKLTPSGRRLATVALRASAGGSPSEAYRAAPPGADEFSSDDEPLAWDADGWDEFDASRSR